MGRYNSETTIFHLSRSQSVDCSQVRYNEVQWKAAHNSVTLRETIFEQLDNQDGNCGAIELDFVIDPKSITVPGTEEEHNKLSQEEIEKYNGWRFSVQHHLTYHENAAIMTDVLRSLRKWSLLHQDHHVITVCLDMKKAHVGTHVEFISQLDDAIIWGIGRDRLFTPGDLMRDAPTLVEGAKKYGWPTIDLLRNKFIFVITGSDVLCSQVAKRRQTYCTTNPSQRICFVDIDQRACKSHSGYAKDEFANPYYSQQTDRVFLNIKLGLHDWKRLGRESFLSGWMLSRVWKANKYSQWAEAIESNIHFIATDMIRENWASVSSERPFSMITLTTLEGN